MHSSVRRLARSWVIWIIDAIEGDCITAEESEPSARIR